MKIEDPALPVASGPSPDLALDPSSPSDSTGGLVLLAHGAGGHKDHPHMLALASMLQGLGLGVVRFDFPYKRPGADGKRRVSPPDPMPVLVRSVASAAQEACARFHPRFFLLAGHSMGGRAVSMAAAEGSLPEVGCRGILLFSYPFHPPKQPERLRVAHLPGLSLPVLALTGTRDAFCDRRALDGVFRELPPSFETRFLEGADHGWAVAKKSGRTREQVLAEARAICGEWLTRIVR